MNCRDCITKKERTEREGGGGREKGGGRKGTNGGEVGTGMGGGREARRERETETDRMR